MWIASCLIVLVVCQSEPVVGSEPEAVSITPQAAPSSEQHLTPEADTYVAAKGDDHQNFGAELLLRVERSGDKRSLARWDLDAIADAVGGGSLVRAELEFTVSANGGGWGASGGVIRVHSTNRAWAEEGATRACPDDSDLSNNQADCSDGWRIGGDPIVFECIPIDSDVDCPIPTYRPTPSDSLIATDELAGQVSFEVTEDVREMLADEPPAIPYREGWLLRKSDGKAKGSIAFGSRESGTPPRLLLTTEGQEGELASPPDSLPTAIYADPANIIEDPACADIPFMRSIVTVTFVEGTTPGQRQAAVDLVEGTVVGGVPLSEQGIYLIQVEDDETGSGVCSAEAALEELPTVDRADPDDIAEPDFRRPKDGVNWREWRLDPDAADGENWALEAIDAPLAWGCETGRDSVPIMSVDDEFHVGGIADVDANVGMANSVGLDPTSGPGALSSHGTSVASIMAAAGSRSSPSSCVKAPSAG